MNDPNPRSRWAAAVLAVATISALVLVATPAGAVDPTTAENFGPDTTGTPAGPPQNATNDTETSPMSDRADGGNSTFHATTVTSTDVSLVQYFICPVAFTDGQVGDADVATNDPTQAANGCGASVGQDTTGALPPAPGVPAGAGEAYEAEIDITVDGVRDFVAWVCTALPADATNCDAEVEPSVTLDNASTDPGTATSSGEIVAPLHPGNVSNEGFVASARTSPDVTGVTFCLAALDATAPTVADEAGDPTQCITDANFGGMGATTTIKTDTTPDNPTGQQTTFKTWSAAYTAAETPDNLEMALLLFEGTADDGIMPANSGAGSCTSMIPGDIDCQLDSHYVVSTPPAGTTARIAFPDEGNTATLPNNCTEAEATSSGEEEPKQYSRIQGCILDQGGNNITDTVHWAFQITPADTVNEAADETGFECMNPGPPPKACSDTNFPTTTSAPMSSGEHQVQIGMPPASFGFPNYECNGRAPNPGPPFGTTACPTGPVGADGVQNDLNADRFYEQADGDPGQTAGGTAGIADEVIDLHTMTTYTVIFCLDSNNDASQSAAIPSQTPCAGETVSTTGTKVVAAPVDHVHVKAQSQTDAKCHTGDAVLNVPAGGSLTLQGCALALLDTTNEQGVAGVHVIWLLNPEGTTGNTGTLSAAQNTTSSQGQATASVSSTAGDNGKSTTVRFCLDEFPASMTGGQDGNNTCDAAEGGSGADIDTLADIRINWGKGADDFCDPLRPTAEDGEIIVGTAASDRICGFGGPDTLRGVGGKDTLLGGRADDVLVGGAGKDTTRGGGGNDTMRGGKGNDKLKGSGGRKDTARGGPGKDFCKAETEKGCEKG